MDKDEIKNRISLALKDYILQQGFECICKEIADLKTYNEKLLNGDIEKHNKIAELEAKIEKMKLCLSKWYEYENERDVQINVDELLTETQQLISKEIKRK